MVNRKVFLHRERKGDVFCVRREWVKEVGSRGDKSLVGSTGVNLHVSTRTVGKEGRRKDVYGGTDSVEIPDTQDTYVQIERPVSLLKQLVHQEFKF